MPDFPIDSLRLRLTTLARGFIRDRWDEANLLPAITGEAEIICLKENIEADCQAEAMDALERARKGDDGGLLPGADDAQWVVSRQPGDEESHVTADVTVDVTKDVTAGTNGVEPAELVEAEAAKTVPGPAAEEIPDSAEVPLAAFKNYHTETENQPDGSVRQVNHPRTQASLVQEAQAILSPWPKIYANHLVHEAPDGRASIIEKTSDLLAAIGQVRQVRWQKGPGLVTQEQLLSALRVSSPTLTAWVDYPLEPLPPGFHLHRRWARIPEGNPGDLIELEALFNPASEVDRVLLHALFLTPFWGGPPGARPLFVLTGPEGVGVQATGKTTLATTIGSLCGGCVWLQNPRLNDDSIAKQLLAYTGLRVCLRDNAGPEDIEALAELVTSTVVHGRAAYGRQHSIPNYFTWLLTAVSPHLSQDLASRAVVIHLNPPASGAVGDFRRRLASFQTGEWPTRLVASCISSLRSHSSSSTLPSAFHLQTRSFRFPQWALACFPHNPASQEAIDSIPTRQSQVSASNIEVDLFLDLLRSQGPKSYSAQEMAAAWNTAQGGKSHSSAWAIRRVMTAYRTGLLPKWVFRRGSKHGSPWTVARDEEE